MNLDDVKRDWQSQPEPGEPKMSETEILNLVKARSTTFDRTITHRDRREAIAAAVVAVLFIPVLVHGPWLSRAGAVIVLAAMVLIVGKLWRARRTRVGEQADLSLKELLNAERAKIDRQIHLLKSVLSWYIIPPTIGVLMVDSGVTGVSWFTLGYVAFVAALCFWIYRINQRAVRNQLLPRREELDRLIQQLRV